MELAEAEIKLYPDSSSMLEYWKRTGHCCPKCHTAMIDPSPQKVIIGFDPKRTVHCPSCNFSCEVSPSANSYSRFRRLDP